VWQARGALFCLAGADQQRATRYAAPPVSGGSVATCRHPPRTHGSGALVHSQDAVSRHGPRARRACVPPRRARRCPGKSRSSPVPVGRHQSLLDVRSPNALDLPVYGGCSSLDSGTAAPGRRHAADCDACLSLSAPVGQASSCASEGPVPSLIRRGVCAGRSSYGRLSRDLSA
jgi:hypothetical protein